MRRLYFVQTEKELNGEPFTGTRYRVDYVEGAHGPYLTPEAAGRAVKTVARGAVEEWAAVPLAEYEALVAACDCEKGSDGATEPSADEVEVSAPQPEEPVAGGAPVEDASAVADPSALDWNDLMKQIRSVRGEWDWVADEAFEADATPNREQAEAVYREAVRRGLL